MQNWNNIHLELCIIYKMYAISFFNVLSTRANGTSFSTAYKKMLEEEWCLCAFVSTQIIKVLNTKKGDSNTGLILCNIAHGI